MLEEAGLFRISFIDKDDIRALDFTKIEGFINEVCSNGYTTRAETLIISIDGYNEDVREVYDIAEIRKYFRELLKKHPYVFYYLDDMVWELPYICACVDVVDVQQDGDENKVYMRRDIEFIRETFAQAVMYCIKNNFEDVQEFEEKLSKFLISGKLDK